MRRRALNLRKRLQKPQCLGLLHQQTVPPDGLLVEDLVRRAGLIALRQSLSTSHVTMAHFEEAFADSRASVTPEMEQEYEAMSSRLKQDALAIQPIGFIAPGMLHPLGAKDEG